MRLVLVEDDPTIAEPLVDGLRRAGFDNAVHFQGGVSMWRTLGGPLRA